MTASFYLLLEIVANRADCNPDSGK